MHTNELCKLSKPEVLLLQEKEYLHGNSVFQPQTFSYLLIQFLSQVSQVGWDDAIIRLILKSTESEIFYFARYCLEE